MTLKEHQELIQHIERLANRTGVCANPVDKEMHAKSTGYLVDYQYLKSKELEE